MMWNKQNIFEPSGCFSREAFSAFLNDELPADIKAIANEHFASCPFCADALEGFKTAVSGENVAEVMASTDIVFKEKFLVQGRKDSRKKIIWISLSAAATILLLLGLFTIFRNNQPEAQLADNHFPKKETPLPPEASKTVKTEPKPLIAQIVTKEKIQVDKKQVSPLSTEVRSEEPVSVNKIVADDLSEINSAVETENKKKEVSIVAGTPITMADTSSVGKAQLAMKSVGYIASDEAYANRTETAPATASGLRRSNTDNRKKLAKAKKDEVIVKEEAAAEQDQIFVQVEEPATFQGGDLNKFREYVAKQTKYPELLKDTITSSKGIVQFTVDTNGKVTDIKILRSINPEIDNEVIRVLKNSPLWTPAKQAGRPVKQQFVLPIIISIK